MTQEQLINWLVSVGVYVQHTSNTTFARFNNHYKIYEGKHFKYNNRNAPYDMLHLCLGQVNYPIDNKVISEAKIPTPLALKFDIGDLDVTINREELRYTPRTIQAIKEKISSLKGEMEELFKKQDTTVTTFLVIS